MMLSKTENRVMAAIYAQCRDKKSLLISPADLLQLAGGNITLTEVEKIVADLATDGYFDLVYSDRHGETVYCLTLLERGMAYQREILQRRRNVIFRIGLSVALAVFSFIIGLILKAVF